MGKQSVGQQVRAITQTYGRAGKIALLLALGQLDISDQLLDAKSRNGVERLVKRRDMDPALLRVMKDVWEWIQDPDLRGVYKACFDYECPRKRKFPYISIYGYNYPTLIQQLNTRAPLKMTFLSALLRTGLILAQKLDLASYSVSERITPDDWGAYLETGLLQENRNSDRTLGLGVEWADEIPIVQFPTTFGREDYQDLIRPGVVGNLLYGDRGAWYGMNWDGNLVLYWPIQLWKNDEAILNSQDLLSDLSFVQVLDRLWSHPSVLSKYWCETLQDRSLQGVAGGVFYWTYVFETDIPLVEDGGWRDRLQARFGDQFSEGFPTLPQWLVSSSLWGEILWGEKAFSARYEKQVDRRYEPALLTKIRAAEEQLGISDLL